MKPFREITSITPQDTFLIYERIKDDFDYPLHFHPEFELNFIRRADGVRRVIGNHMEEIGAHELVLVGPNLSHCWEMYKCKSENIHEITIQFQENLFEESFLNRRIAKPIKDLLNRARYGVLFSQETAKSIMPDLQRLTGEESLETHLSFFTIIYKLAISKNQRVLNQPDKKLFNTEKNKRLELLYEYLTAHFDSKILLADVADHVNMSVVSLNRFLKKHTNRTFVDFLNDIRLGFASRWLIESDMSISEIAFKSGFNNLAHFNRVFKKAKNETPSAYREEFSGIKKVL
ncbi:MAG: AraC family transcriptional regulator [Bacteroidetes bacterium]|nr:AraC family transcriptional regulator [Bacteroidota bacterium]